MKITRKFLYFAVQFSVILAVVLSQEGRPKRHLHHLDTAMKVIGTLTGGRKKGGDEFGSENVDCRDNACGHQAPPPPGYGGQPNYYNPVPNYYPYGYPPTYVPPNGYPMYPSPYQGYNQGQHPNYQVNVNQRPSQKPANININIPSNQPAQNTPPVSVPNINNVIYGPAPPSNVNNNFYGSAPPSQTSSKFCNPNTEFNCYNGKCLTDPLQLCDGKNDCGNRVDEINCNHINFNVKLLDDGNPQQGRSEGIVEVTVKGQRGCVCNRNFDIHDADVACREMGFKGGCEKINRVSRSSASRLFPEGVPYLMDNVNCYGNETSLKDCDFNGWGRVDNSCGKRNIVSLSCQAPDDQFQRPVPPQPSFGADTSLQKCDGNQFTCKSTNKCIPIDRICDQYADCEDQSDETLESCNVPVQIRLSGGQSVTEGRVEVRVHGIWGTVCDKSFGENEASVICRTLGFLGQPQIVKGSTYGHGTGPIWLDDVSCPTSDTCCLTSCANLKWGRSTSCTHNQDVGVLCSNLLRYN